MSDHALNLDFNTSENEPDDTLIPERTTAELEVEIVPGDEGPNGMLTKSKTSDVIMLCCIFTIISDLYKGRKIFQNIMLDGGKRDPNTGQSISGKIGRKTLKSILESARNIRSNDVSEEAIAARKISGYEEFNGLTVWGVIGIEKDKSGEYPDKNIVKYFLTPGMTGYRDTLA